MLSLLLVAGIRLYREGLAHLLEQQHDIHILGSYASAREAVANLPPTPADVLLLDMASADGRDGAQMVRTVLPSTPLVAIGIADSEAEVLACAECGASAYVTRNGSISELVAAARCAARGELNCSPRIAGTLVRRVAALAKEQYSATHLSRERSQTSSDKSFRTRRSPRGFVSKWQRSRITSTRFWKNSTRTVDFRFNARSRRPAIPSPTRNGARFAGAVDAVRHDLRVSQS
jgi:DNA-binding NarL/FixJ family response regulator